MLPIHYALRNLFRDRARLAQTVIGSALVVLLVLAASALNHGMVSVLGASGSPKNVILLGTGSEESVQRSEVSASLGDLAEAGVAGIQNRLGVAAVSPEIHYMTFLQSGRGPRSQALLRGVLPQALAVHPQVRLLAGTFPRPGELMAGHLAPQKLGLPSEALGIGSEVILDGVRFRISGTFAAPGTVMEAELWADLNDLKVIAQRDTLSCVVLRLDDPADFAEADLFCKQRLDLELTAIRETDYYSALGKFFRPMRAIIWITAGLVVAGAVCGGLNTLYAAFGSRIRELATLRAIGFSRPAVLLSLIQESTIACLIGTLLATCLALLVLDGRTIPFSIGIFRISMTPLILLVGLASGFLLGVLGVLPPAFRCLKPALPKALRSS